MWFIKVGYRNGLEETVGGFDTREDARVYRRKLGRYKATGTDYDVINVSAPRRRKK